MSRRTRAWLSVAAPPALLVGAAAWLTVAQVRQERLDAALLEAAREGNTTQARVLLDQGANPNARAGSRTVTAWRARLSQITGRLAGRPAAPSREPTPLIAMFEPCHLPGTPPNEETTPPESPDLVRLLLARGADPKARSAQGETPLHLALAAQYERSAQLLVERGANVNAIAEMVPGTPMAMATGWCSRPTAQFLLAHGADVNLADREGSTPLLVAAWRDPATIRYLLDRGARVDAYNVIGATAYMRAAQYGKRAAAEELLRGGADPLAQNVVGETAIDMAKQAGQTRIIPFLKLAEQRERAAHPGRRHQHAPMPPGGISYSGP